MTQVLYHPSVSFWTKMRFPLMRNNILPADVQPVIDLLQQPDPRLTSGPKVLEFEEAWSGWPVFHTLFL